MKPWEKFKKDQQRLTRLRDLFGYNTDPPVEHPSTSESDGRKFLAELEAGAKIIGNGPVDRGQIE